MSKVNCNKCKKDFSITVNSKIIDTGVSAIYMRCQHCKIMYILWFENREIKENLKKIEKLEKKGNKEEIGILIKKNNIIKDQLYVAYIGEWKGLKDSYSEGDKL